MPPEFNPRTISFICAVVSGTQPTQAAIEAGYSARTAYMQSSRMMRNDEIASEIQRRRNKLAQRVEIAQTDVLREWALVAFSDMRNYLQIREDGSMGLDFAEMPDEATKAIQSFTEETRRAKDGSEITRTKLTLHPKTTALDALSRYLGIYARDKAQALAGIDQVILALAQKVGEMSADQRMARLQELRRRALAEGAGEVVEGVSGAADVAEVTPEEGEKGPNHNIECTPELE